MKRNSYHSTSWYEWFVTWLTVLIGVPLGLVASGFFAKVLFNCFMAGWSLI